MTLNENAQVDTSQVEDARGSGGGGGGLGGMIPGGRGGLVGAIITLLVVLAGGGTVIGSQMGGGGGGNAPSDNSSLSQECASTNPDRTRQQDCRNVLYINSIQNFWTTELPQVAGKQYQKAPTEFFSQSVNTGCGQADSGVGPFYCPPDKKVYIDLTFYDELASRFGAKGQFAQPYVLAHEYGHHIQTLLGTEAQVRRAQQRDPNNNQYSIGLELQADCYAGVWAKHATETKDANGQPIFTSVTPQDIQQALDAAAAVGDDTIQKKMGNGSVDESKFTHGTSAQRQQWFNAGFTSGNPGACDTFKGSLG